MSTAILRFARISPQKIRLVADQIRGLPVEMALDILKFSNKKGGLILHKLLESAIANAENNDGKDIDELYVSEVYANVGPVFKRMRARAKGRGSRIFKRTSHVTVSVIEREDS